MCQPHHAIKESHKAFSLQVTCHITKSSTLQKVCQCVCNISHSSTEEEKLKPPVSIAGIFE